MKTKTTVTLNRTDYEKTIKDLTEEEIDASLCS